MVRGCGVLPSGKVFTHVLASTCYAGMWCVLKRGKQFTVMAHAIGMFALTWKEMTASDMPSHMTFVDGSLN